ncbi:unnamed protein product [Echinostoma caproni]|uniref:Purine nucleoside phosphorylase n=1 Tax=Echinostoma caproni TaxID=27848 RepID=A0A183AH05_9TREM|nr:unnamed protein product [Echinostoma caproni]
MGGSQSSHDCVVDRIVAQIRAQTDVQPQVAIVCGSGLGGLAKSVEKAITIPYSSIKDFPQTTVSGHNGNFIFGQLKSKSIVIMQGRLHQYEGFTHDQMVLPMRVLKQLGVSIVLLTNAAGGLKEKLNVGDLVVLNDHISLSGLGTGNVLIGPNNESLGPRFPATTDAYDEELRKILLSKAKQLGIDDCVHEGVYFHVMGPTYTTNAECRMMLNMGADVVGMSTVPEVFVARHCGLRVAAVSLVSDNCNPDRKDATALTHEEVLKAANQHATKLEQLCVEFVSVL